MRFYRRRARRILPPYYAAIAFSAAILIFEALFRHPPSFPFTGWGFLVNISLLGDIFTKWNPEYNAALWSVATEWKIYFLFPLMLWSLKRYGCYGVLGVAILAALVAAGICRLMVWRQLTEASTYTCPWFILLFSFGVCAGWVSFQAQSARPLDAFSLRARGFSWGVAAGAAAVILAGFLLRWPIDSDQMNTSYSRHFLEIDVAAGAFMAAGLGWLQQSSVSSLRRTFRLWLVAIFSWRPLVAVGGFSYSIYLVHLPLVVFFTCWLPLKLNPQGVNVLGHVGLTGYNALIVLITLGMAYLFHLAFERPFMTKPGVKIRTQTQAEAAAIVNPAP